MSNRIFLFALSLIFSLSLAAQKTGHRGPYRQMEPTHVCSQTGDTVSAECSRHAREFRQQKREQKRLYFVSQMQLNDIEREAFLALYDKYSAACNASKKDIREASKSITDASTDKDYASVVKIIEEQEEKQCELRDEFIEKLEKTFSPKQVYLFFSAERSFNRQLVRDFEGSQTKMAK